VARTALILFTIVVGFAAQPTARVELTGPLAEWKKEIESLDGHSVVVARVYYNPRNGVVRLPPDAPERPAIVEYLRNPNFLKQFVAMHAITIHHKDGDRTLHIVLLNMGRLAEWGRHEDALIGQEFARISLYTRNYPEPAYDGREEACIGIQAADLLQRQLIRRELKRRGIDYNAYLLPLLETAMRQMERAEVRPVEEIPTCALMSKLVLWLDARLGITDKEWPARGRFLRALKRMYPILERTSDDLYGQLAPLDLGDQETYTRALELVMQTMYGFVRLVLKRPEIRIETETIQPRQAPARKPSVPPLPGAPPENGPLE